MSALMLLVGINSVLSQIPSTLSYQGVLHDGAGGAVPNGSYDITFRLYDVASGGTALWSETNTVSVQGGIFSIILGNVTALNLPFDEQYWLGVSVDGGSEFSPRRPLTASAYSLKTKSVEDGSVTGAGLADNSVVRSVNSLQDDVTLAAGPNVSISSSGDSLIIGATSVGDDDWTVVGNDMYSSVSGNIGIGTTNPTTNLHVEDNSNSVIGIRLRNMNTGSQATQRIFFDNEQGEVAGIQILGSGWPGVTSNRMTIFNNRTNGRIDLNTAGFVQMTLANSGNVGIGESFPSEKLQVDGTIHSQSGGFKFPDGTTQTTSATDQVYFSVKRDASYNWPTNGSVQTVDFSTNSTVWENVGGGFNQVSSTFIAPVSGMYSLHGAVNFRSVSVGDMVYVELYVGGKYYRGTHVRANGTPNSCEVHVSVYLDSGQGAMLRGYVNAASPPASVYGNSSATFAFTHFSGALVR